MSHVFFTSELEGIATFWRIFRRDGIALGFTSHDRDLWFDGLLHRAAPGMVPSAIRRTADLSPDSSEVDGVLSHDSIAASDLAGGRYDDAAIAIGAVDWETLDRAILYNGTIASVSGDGDRFSADIRSIKHDLERDFVPRTSPTCRAVFCGPGCTLSAARFTREAIVTTVDREANACTFGVIVPTDFVGGELMWVDGDAAGSTSEIVSGESGALVLSQPLPDMLKPGDIARLREGCDHTLATCNDRFANAANFQGEPFLPGNDLLSRYPLPE